MAVEGMAIAAVTAAIIGAALPDNHFSLLIENHTKAYITVTVPVTNTIFFKYFIIKMLLSFE